VKEPRNSRGLPERLHLKSGRYYYVKRGPAGNLVWNGLSRNLKEALAQHKLIEEGKSLDAFEQYGAPAHWLGGVARLLHEQSKKRARAGDIIHLLTPQEIVDIGMASNWRCAVTGLKFSRDKLEGSPVRPFMPSLDRIKGSLGYTKDNCRLVCVVVNFAMNQWGESVLNTMSVAYVKHHNLLGSVRVSNAELEKLRAKVAELEKTAERYAVLKSAGWIDGAIMKAHGIDHEDPSTLDAALDAYAVCPG
jgi:hypothetical protein